MPSVKPLVFISHITEEKQVASDFKSLIEHHFLGMMEVFVSSDGKSISMGQQWLSEITAALDVCAVEVIIASPASVTRPWINFEAGAGWIRKVPVIPLCHSGMSPSGLPIPLKLLQAGAATDRDDLRRTFSVLAAALGAVDREPDLPPFIEKVKAFEVQYTFWGVFKKGFAMFAANEQLIELMRRGDPFEIRINATTSQELSQYEPFFLSNELLKIERVGVSLESEPMTRCKVTPLKNLAEVLSRCVFKF